MRHNFRNNRLTLISTLATHNIEGYEDNPSAALVESIKEAERNKWKVEFWLDEDEPRFFDGGGNPSDFVIPLIKKITIKGVPINPN